MNEQEPVLTQLPLRTGAGGEKLRAGRGSEQRARRACGLRAAGVRDRAQRTGLRGGGMERLAPRVCLALLWGCVLAAAAAAQGKEGECARGAAWAPAPRASRSPAG